MRLFKKCKTLSKLTVLLCWFWTNSIVAQEADTLDVEEDTIETVSSSKFNAQQIIPVYSQLREGRIPQAVIYGGVHTITLLSGVNYAVKASKLKQSITTRLDATAIDSTLEISSPFYLEIQDYYFNKIARNTSFGLFGMSLFHSFVTAKNVTNPSIQLQVPTKRAMASAAIPGLGQVMNGKIWKVPIVYAALGATLYFTSVNFQEFRKFRTLSVLLENQKSFEAQQFYTFYNAKDGLNYESLNLAAANQYAAYYKKNLDNLVLATLGVYALQIVDALVDAHFSQAPKDIEITQSRVIPISNMNVYTGQFNFGFQYTF